MDELMIKIENVSKQYRLGAIGGGTLQGDLQSWWARKRGKEDPNSKIGSKVHEKNEKFLALDSINLEVKKGERVGIIGHNGAGKSTLLKLLSRVTAPTTGEIKLNGRISSMLEVGTGFHGELTGRENIYMNGAILGMSKKEIDSKIEDIIEFSECRQFIDTPVKRYSSGMYVKLAFAVAAHLDSEILIMDEVLAVGDMAFQKKCLDKMSEVSKGEGRTILYVSHNMNTIRQLCDRCVVLDHGKKVYDGDVEEAISIYSSKVLTDSKIVNLDVSKRPYDYMGTRIRIVNYERESESSNYCFNEYLRFTLNVISKEPNISVRLRCDIHYKNGDSIGIYESKTFVINHGNNIIKTEIKLEHLPYGEYYMVFDIYEINSSFKHYSLDHPLESIVFKIVSDNHDAVAWDHSYMGHVRLGNIEILSK